MLSFSVGFQSQICFRVETDNVVIALLGEEKVFSEESEVLGVSEQSFLSLTLPCFSYRRSQVLLISKTEVRLALKITNQEFFRQTQQKESSHHRGTEAYLVLSHLLSEINQQCISAGKSFAFPLMAKMRAGWLGDVGVLTHVWSILQWKQSSLWSSIALGSKFTCHLLLWGFKEYNVQMIHPGSGHRVRLSRLMALVSRQWGPCREIKKSSHWLHLFPEYCSSYVFSISFICYVMLCMLLCYVCYVILLFIWQTIGQDDCLLSFLNLSKYIIIGTLKHRRKNKDEG